MSEPEICFLDAVELAALIRDREMSVREVTEAHLRRVERVNPRVNAVVTLTPERALRAADLADEALARGNEVGPLHGLPVAHKDLTPTRGVRTAFGSPMYRDFVPDRDAPIVERLRVAGSIMVGKTSTPEFGAAGDLGPLRLHGRRSTRGRPDRGPPPGRPRRPATRPRLRTGHRLRETTSARGRLTYLR